MNKKSQRIILVVALIILAVALALLVYGLLPTTSVKELFPVTPTYLVPPAIKP
jgi:flagellar basal body-associated protein FliL